MYGGKQRSRRVGPRSPSNTRLWFSSSRGRGRVRRRRQTEREGEDTLHTWAASAVPLAVTPSQKASSETSSPSRRSSTTISLVESLVLQPEARGLQRLLQALGQQALAQALQIVMMACLVMKVLEASNSATLREGSKQGMPCTHTQGDTQREAGCWQFWACLHDLHALGVLSSGKQRSRRVGPRSPSNTRLWFCSSSRGRGRVRRRRQTEREGEDTLHTWAAGAVPLAVTPSQKASSDPPAAPLSCAPSPSAPSSPRN